MISFSLLGEESYLANNRVEPSQGLLRAEILLGHLNSMLSLGEPNYNSHLRGQNLNRDSGRKDLNREQTCYFIITGEKTDCGQQVRCSDIGGEERTPEL